MTTGKKPKHPAKNKEKPAKIEAVKPVEELPKPKTDGSMKEKIILLVVEIIVIGGIVFLFGQRYNSLMEFDDVKWEKAKIECLTDNCDSYKQKIYIYRLG